MAQPKLTSADQSAATRSVLRLYEVCASLQLAVILIFTMAATLAFATFVEAAYGTASVQFFIYQTWWFNVLNAALAINIFCAAAIRFPWQRHQTGFVITHIGLLTLLFGALIGRFRGIDAQIPIYEDQSGQYAFDGSDLRFDINVRSTDRDTEGEDTIQLATVPFPCSPMNWQDFSTLFEYHQPEEDAQLVNRINPLAHIGWKILRSTTGAVFKLASKTQANDVVFNQDDIKLEVLDFYSDSREISVPNLKFKMSLPSATKIGADGKSVKGPVRWVPVELNLDPRQVQANYPLGMPDTQMLGGGRAMLSIAHSAAHTEAFLQGGPEGMISAQGQAVIFAGQKRHVIDIADRLGKGKFPLEGTSFQAEVAEYWNAWKVDERAAPGQLQWTNDPSVTEPRSPVVLIHLYAVPSPESEETTKTRLLLFANNPEGNVHDYRNKIYGEYWFDFSQLKQQEASQLGASDRLEFFQSHDHKLYYRYWKRAANQLQFTQELPLKGSPETAVNAFKMPIAQLKLYVTEYHASDKPGKKTLPLPFNSQKTLVQNRAVAKLRLSVNEQSQERWVRIFVDTPERSPQNDQVIEVATKNRIVSVSMPSKAVDIGFRIQLKNFERKLDPGTSQASHFSSWVDFLDRQAQSQIRSYSLQAKKASRFKIPCNTLPPDTLLGIDQLRLQGQVAISPGGKQLIWTDPLSARLQQIPLANLADGKPGTLSLQTAATLPDPAGPGSSQANKIRASRPLALAIHPATADIYWVDQQAFHGGQVSLLYKSDPDGKNTVLVIQEPGIHLDRIVIAASQEKIYWTDKRRGRIGRCNLDGSEPEPTLIIGLKKPEHICLDRTSQTLFWSEEIDGRGQIRNVRLDAVGRVGPATVVELSQPHHVVRGLTIDGTKEALYWIESEEHPGGYIGKHTQDVVPTSWLMTSTMLGTDQKNLPLEGLNQSNSLVLDEQSQVLYWNQAASYRHDVYITMNAPVEFSNPVTGQTYRLFQESFNGPWKPGSAEYEEMILPTSDKEELYLSVLTVNADPGRWIRNLGCLFVVMGIATMFYMRAYFFKPRRKPTPAGLSGNTTINP